MDLTKIVDLKETILSNSSNAIQSNQYSEAIIDRKLKALESFDKSGFPTTKHEEYKYFNLNQVLKNNFSLAPESKVSEGEISSNLLDGLEYHKLVFVNGKFSTELSNIIAGDNLVMTSFKDADQEIVEKYYAKEVYTSNDPFAELNTAMAQDGVFIKAFKNKVVKHPVVMHFVSDAKTDNPFIQSRNLIVAEENAQITLLEIYTTLGDNISFNNTVTEIVQYKDSLVDYYKLQNDTVNSIQVGTTVATLVGKSVFNACTITLDGAMVRNNMHVVLQAEYCEANFNGLYFTGKKQVVDNHTVVDHAVPHCLSNELYKGIIDDASTGVFNGKIFVKKDAQKTNAFQSNKNILLTKDAIMHTKPQLEIFADDVKCSHGATIGQLEEEPLFYLRTRGISEESARALLLVAFAQDIIDQIKIEPLKIYLSKAIEKRLSR
jgi:Fe-S cluster assembly protein SufD